LDMGWNQPDIPSKYRGHELLGRRCGMLDACRLSVAFGVLGGDS
jgi:hypothetical protein